MASLHYWVRYRRPWAFGVALYIAPVPPLRPLAKWVALNIGVLEGSTDGKTWTRI